MGGKAVKDHALAALHPKAHTELTLMKKFTNLNLSQCHFAKTGHHPGKFEWEDNQRLVPNQLQSFLHQKDIVPTLLPSAQCAQMAVFNGANYRCQPDVTHDSAAPKRSVCKLAIGLVHLEAIKEMFL